MKKRHKTINSGDKMWQNSEKGHKTVNLGHKISQANANKLQKRKFM